MSIGNNPPPVIDWWHARSLRSLGAISSDPELSTRRDFVDDLATSETPVESSDSKNEYTALRHSL